MPVGASQVGGRRRYVQNLIRQVEEERRSLIYMAEVQRREILRRQAETAFVNAALQQMEIERRQQILTDATYTLFLAEV